MKEDVEIYLLRKKRAGNKILWSHNSDALRRILEAVKAYDPEIYAQFNFIIKEFDSNRPHTMIIRNLSRIANQSSKLNENLQAKLKRPAAGRRHESLDAIRESLNCSKNYKEFNLKYKSLTGHLLSRSTYQRAKRNLSSYLG